MSSFDDFKANFKGDIVTPSDAEYEAAISRWAANATRRAKIVAFVKNEADIAAAIAYARAEKLPLAIRGGGHSASGTSSQTDGLVIDLSRHLKTVRVDPDKKLAYVGGGAKWEAVDKAAIAHGLATTGGTMNDTGVGGLTLGGGIGWLAAKHGLVIDNLVQATIITADGRALTASKDENSDLFWAIRGGGCNFGVAAEFVLQLHEQRRTVYGGSLVFPGTMISDVFKVLQEWWDKGPSENEGMLVAVTRSPPPDRLPCVVAIVYYNGTEQEGREVYKALHDLKPIVDHTKEIPYEELNAIQNALLYPGQGVYLRGGLQSTIHSARMPELLKHTTELSEPEPDGAAFRIVALFELLPAQPTITRKAAHTDMAFSGRGQNLNVAMIVLWDEITPENEAKGKAKVDALNVVLDSFEPGDTVKPHAYSNYTHGVDTGGGAAALFGENYPRLQKIKGKYDPDNIFNKWFSITPLRA